MAAACNQAVVKIEMNFAGVAAGVEAAIAGVKNDTVGCVPFTVSFGDTLLKGRRYFWDFGDGSPVVFTTRPDTTHAFTVPGRYRVMLIRRSMLVTAAAPLMPSFVPAIMRPGLPSIRSRIHLHQP
ncbi:MAG: PKD domain-containing protein [Ferruginibacter sp.]